MDRAVRNFAEFTGTELAAVAALASRNPARMTGLEAQAGSLEAGRSADLTVLSPGGNVVETILRGQTVARA
jgi:N-acetylglucosamine-6-phosphate deacetylase